MYARYPDEVVQVIMDNYKGKTTKELTELVNRKCNTNYKDSQICAYKNNHKLRSGISGKPKNVYSKLFPEDIALYIQNNYIGVGPQKMTVIINKKFGTKYTVGQIKNYYRNHSLNSGLTGEFKKGHVPFNKGMKGYINPGSEKGWFQKGNVPVNHASVGTEVVDCYGYVSVKVAEPSVWRLKHHVVWEQYNGIIPDGHKVIFLDGDRSNCSIDNLACVSDSVNMRMNIEKLRYDDAELTKTGMLIAMVEDASMKRESRKEE